MLAKLRYLIDEGFDVRSLFCYDEEGGRTQGVILYRVQNQKGERRLVSENFAVMSSEMESCARLLFSHFSSQA